MNKRFLSEALLATTLAACSETGLRPLGDGPETVVESEDSGAPFTETAELPIPPFSELIKNCLALYKESGCPSPDTNCDSEDAAKKSEIRAVIEGSARRASGDSAMTLEDIENGAYVAASAYGHNVFGEFDDYGQSVWRAYGYLHFSFGDHEKEYKEAYETEEGLAAFESVPGLDTISCHAQGYSLDGENMIYEQVYVTAVVADGAGTEISIYDLGESNQWKVNGNFYDVNGSTLDFAPAQNALNVGAAGALEATSSLAGDVEEKNERVHQY